MITMKDINTCSRKGCLKTGTVKNGRYSLFCEKHYRFMQMRYTAKRSGKLVPSWGQCEKMLHPCLNEDGNLGGCPCCKRQMQWRASGPDKKTGSTISLQHNNDGTMQFICTSCNVAHGNSKLGDGWYDIPEDHKHCPGCSKTKPLTEFYQDRSKNKQATTTCKACNSANKRQRYAAKRQEVLA